MLGENLMEEAWFWKAPILKFNVTAIQMSLHSATVDILMQLAPHQNLSVSVNTIVSSGIARPRPCPGIGPGNSALALATICSPQAFQSTIIMCYSASLV